MLYYWFVLQDILKKCEHNVSDHKLYKEKSRDLGQWLTRAKEKFADNADTSGTRQELEERLERIQVGSQFFQADA